MAGQAMSLPGYMPNMNFFRLLKLKRGNFKKPKRDEVKTELIWITCFHPYPTITRNGKNWGEPSLKHPKASTGGHWKRASPRPALLR